MKTEFEVKILDIDVEAIREKLDSLGAKKVMERNMRRYTYDINPKDKTTWMRLRDEGDKVTLTIKKIHDLSIGGTKESEVVVSNFDNTNLILMRLGFLPKVYQENKRISYLLDDVEVEIDFWPKVPPYIEVEGKSVKEVEQTVKKLGFDMSQTSSLDTDGLYQKYGLNIYDFKELKF